MSLVPHIESNTVSTAGGPDQPVPPAPVTTPLIAAIEPAAYDGSPTLTAWTWSWAKTGGSLVELADALRVAAQIRSHGGLAAGAHAGVDPPRALALLSD